MAMPLGASFVPSEENAQYARQNAGQEPVSQAIKVLALRLPKVVGAQAMSPGALMQPHITGYAGPDPIVRAAIEQALGGNAPGGVTGPGDPSPAPTLPPPQVTPGDPGTRAMGPDSAPRTPGQWRTPRSGGGFRGY